MNRVSRRRSFRSFRSRRSLLAVAAFAAGGIFSAACLWGEDTLQPACAIKTEALEKIKSVLQSKRMAKGANSGFDVVYEKWFDVVSGRHLPVKIYIPNSTPGPYPLVIFSHGLGGSVEAAVYLGEYWAQHGYIGIFIQHPGSDTDILKPALGAGRAEMMRTMKEAANGKNLLDRAQDIHFAIDEVDRRLNTDPNLKGKIDVSRIAVAGHSFGAGTALAVAGQFFRTGTYTDARIKSAIYLCPPVIGAGSFVPEQRYGSIKIPGMLLTGTKDTSPIGDTKAEDRRIPYDGIGARHQYLVNFDGADHGVFGGRSFRAPAEGDEKYHEMIAVVTTKFLDSTLNHDAAATKWLDAGGAATYLGKAAVYEHK